MKTAFTLFLFCSFSCALFSSGPDSVNVISYRIHIDSIEYGNKALRAMTEIDFSPTVNNVNQVSFDLLELQVDSIKQNNVSLTWSYNDTLLRATLLATANTSDTVRLKIWYHGSPVLDASTFGGYYFSDTTSNAYIFNIGVGFDADPHNYGRVWFPCRDNFTDKALYEYYVKAPLGQMAVCGGSLQSVTPNANGTQTWFWRHRDPIPTYLASMAVANYIELRDSFVSMAGDTVPVLLHVKAVDSLDALVLFANLHAAFDAFEYRLGPMQFERIGFVGVPFNAGAMEHATNVAFPVAFLNGTLAGENTIMHELAHSWFGNLVTCNVAEEMWINEGLASYCVALFQEEVYGETAFRDYVRTNSNDVLRRAHILDGIFRAVSGVPHNFTYGKTVYDKGAMMAHALRGYMGDSLFFGGIKQFFADRAFGNAHSDSLKNTLENYSGLSLDGFFDAWIYQPGFVHYSVDTFHSVFSGGNFQVTVTAKQKLREATLLCNQNSLEIAFIGSGWEKEIRSISWNGQSGSATFTLPFNPIAVFADPNQKFGDASIERESVIQALGFHDLSPTYMELNIDSLPDSALVRVIHSYVAADTFQLPHTGFSLSTNRYWKVEGIIPNGFRCSAEFIYDGSVSSGGTNSYIDLPWLNFREDSLVLFFRPDPRTDWQLAPDYQVNWGSPNDKKGRIHLDRLLQGEYAIGRITADFIAIEKDISPVIALDLYPNPAKETLHAKWNSKGKPTAVILMTLEGKELACNWQSIGYSQVEVSLQGMAKGTYFLEIRTNLNEKLLAMFIKE